MEENDNLKDFATSVTEFCEAGFAGANVRELKRGGIIQFERHGYYIFDVLQRRLWSSFVLLMDAPWVLRAKPVALPPRRLGSRKEKTATERGRCGEADKA